MSSTKRLELFADRAENHVDLAAQEEQGRDCQDRDQGKDECVLSETLSLTLNIPKHLFTFPFHSDLPYYFLILTSRYFFEPVMCRVPSFLLLLVYLDDSALDTNCLMSKALPSDRKNYSQLIKVQYEN
jgi:hypothetical protein